MSEEIYDPRERLEIFLNAVRTGDVEDLPDPQTREEMYLAAIAAKSALPDTTDASPGDALMLDEDKIPVWSTPGGGDNYYLHQIRLSFTSPSRGQVRFKIISNDSEAYTKETFFGHLVQVGNPTLDSYGVIYNSNSLIWGCKYTPASLKVQIYILAFTISGTDIHIDEGSGPAIDFSNIALTDNVVKAKIGT
jgi:hypothetical protein